MYRALLRLLAISCGVLGLYFVATPSTSALSLAPSVLEVQLNPGEIKTVAVQVTNDEAAPLRLYPSIQKFVPFGTEGQQRFLPPTDIEGLPSWTFVGVSDRVLQPGETQTVPIEIRIPADAPEGGMYEAIFFSAQPPVPGQASLGIRSRIGVLALVTVGTPAATELTVTDWRLEEAGQRAALQGTVYVKLKNVGRTHVTPRGELVIRGTLGDEVARLPLNSTEARVLPASERVFEVRFGAERERPWLSGIREELSSFGLGRYTISLEGVTGVRNLPTPLSFVVLPWRTLAMLIGGVLVVGLSFSLYRRRLIRSLQTPRT